MPDTSPSPSVIQRMGLGNGEPTPEAKNLLYRNEVANSLRQEPLTPRPTSGNPITDLVNYIKNDQPYMGVLNKIFMTQASPEVQNRVGLSMNRLSGEMPEASRGMVTPMSRFEALVKPGAEAITGASGTGYSPTLVNQMSDPDLDRMLAHELIHQRQLKSPNQALKNSLYNVTHNSTDAAFSNPDEIEAYQYELNREHKGKNYLKMQKSLRNAARANR